MLRIVVSRGGEELGASDHASDHVRIGQDEDNDVHIEDPALTAHHAEIWAFNGHCQIRSPDGNKLSIEGRLVEARGDVNDGEVLAIGDLSFQVLIDPPPEADTLEPFANDPRTVARVTTDLSAWCAKHGVWRFTELVDGMRRDRPDDHSRDDHVTHP